MYCADSENCDCACDCACSSVPAKAQRWWDSAYSTYAWFCASSDCAYAIDCAISICDSAGVAWVLHVLTAAATAIHCAFCAFSHHRIRIT